MKIKQITGEEFRKVCKSGKPVIVRTVGVTIHEPAVASNKITKFIQVVIFSAHKGGDKFSAQKLERGGALASMMIAKEVPVFTLKTSEIEEMRKTGMSQKTGDDMPEVSGVSAVMIDDEIVFCAAVGTVSSLELYEGD